MKRVMLLIDCAGEFDRRLMRGMFRYSKENGGWLFYRIPPAMNDSRPEGASLIADWARKWKADAIVGRWNFSDTSELERLKIPIVLQNIKSRSERFSNLTGDYFGTGKMAADFFYQRRYVNFGYFGVKGLIWSEERRMGFENEARKLGCIVNSLMVNVQEEHNEALIGQWICSLPKPAAVFACDDSHALVISEACRMNGLSIPDDITLLGVDNDELICEISDPPISSISLDVEQGGYLVAQHLGDLIDKKKEGSFNVTIAPGAIIQRFSTQRHNIADPYIDKLIRYIEDNFTQDISTSQILAQVPLSRRSVELKFRKEMNGITIYKYLTICRIEYFAQLLTTTSLPLGEIAMMAGISDYSNFSRIFKKVKGISPMEYRRLGKLNTQG
ncbi:MAG: DNA-binding transcriptional regulator [Candidatus Cryptobacteroides sp.]|nr:DNA-binding transcriptional regulator [Candidatus Cryptobacteroides sp.]